MKKIKKTEEEWKKILDPQTFYITRQAGTEKPFSGKYNNEKSTGIYCCKCCNAELFSSETKYDSQSGWPSFYDLLEEKNITSKIDNSLGKKRIEVLCSNCNAHLGHLFDDGPQPTGKRYCINSSSLNLVKSE
ncbi:MAG: Peptide methionine sulfoxide reductase MsrB [Alphaproteobacteria bacterium MarineAlpha5_Bin9]|nr:MAG: Peptide methionine sulfoxide reductase MsrB [Alphaproteobacteria bacterium MarineAlpha5_Bin9]|tara:strand:- start:9057 stop:9452 length:396 start_codon:yes stop_codon:yes gene_type:complete